MYRIHLQEFEGPLDLLLFFIRRDELDVFDIPIAEIADEYLAYVRVLEQVDLDSVGDFLYMAALLINIKARMLLPSEQVDEEGEPVDPRRELVERLLEYIRFKEASQGLTEHYEERGRRFVRGAASDPDVEGRAEAEVVVDATLFDLIASLRRVLTEVVSEPTHEIVREEYTIDEQRLFLLDVIAREGRVSFVATVRHRTKSFIITTFLAVLEMARAGEVALVLPSSVTDFYLARPEPGDAEPTPEANGTPVASA